MRSSLDMDALGEVLALREERLAKLARERREAVLAGAASASGGYPDAEEARQAVLDAREYE